MPLLLGCFALLTPRLVLVLVWLFSTFLHRAYDTWLWPVLGFFFLPLTTLAYAWAKNSQGSVTGFYLVVVVLAVLVDLGLLGSGARSRRARTAT